MKPLDDNELDSFFKAVLKVRNKKGEFTDHSWKVMEGLLPPTEPAKKKVIWPYRVAASAAALLLLFLGWEWPTFNQKPLHRTAKVALCISQVPYRPMVAASAVNSKAEQRRTVQPGTQTKRRAVKPVDPVNINAVSEHGDGIVTVLITRGGLKIARPQMGFPIGRILSDSLKFSVLATLVDSEAKLNAPNKPAEKQEYAGPRLVLSLLAAPDVNGVNTFNSGKVGNNFAAQLTLNLTRRLSITTGAAYASKPYQTGFNNYMSKNPGWWTNKSSAAAPENVSANCRVLDIPLNINYRLYNRGTNSLLLGTGLSTYFMLQENYRFNFADANTSALDLNFSNANQHWLGVLNLNATYQHQLNNKFGLVMQPYIKLPLTRIGAGQVDLKSAGIAVGLNWNLNAFNNK